MGVSLLTTQIDSSPSPSIEVAFGRFRLIPAQFLLLEDDKPVSLGSRALEILMVLLERPSELISNQDFMERVWPNVFVEPNNLTVNMSALRRALRDGRDGNRFIINIPGRGYKFVASVVATSHQTAPFTLVSQRPPELEKLQQTTTLERAPYAVSGAPARNVRPLEAKTWS